MNDPARNALASITAVFFDAGHTLIFPDFGVYREVALEAGAREADRERILAAELLARLQFERLMMDKRRPGGSWDSSYWNIFYGILFRCLRVGDDRVQWACEELRRRNQEGLGLWTVRNEEALATLDELAARGYLLGVISNSDGRVARLLEHAGLTRHLAFVIDSEVVGVSKPDRRIFDLAVESAGRPAAECLYVGDYLSVDVDGARGAGLVPLLYDPVEAYADPGCLTVRGLGEIPALLPEQPARHGAS